LSKETSASAEKLVSIDSPLKTTANEVTASIGNRPNGASGLGIGSTTTEKAVEKEGAGTNTEVNMENRRAGAMADGKEGELREVEI
jgi:hypothetical protein